MRTGAVAENRFPDLAAGGRVYTVSRKETSQSGFSLCLGKVHYGTEVLYEGIALKRMRKLRIILYAAICFISHSSVGQGQLLHCGKGSLDLSTKDNPGFININCVDFPLAASFPAPSADRCYFSGGKTLKIVWRSGWNAASHNITPIVLTKPSECILADGQSYTISDNNYVRKMQVDQVFQNREFGNFLHNFHIGDNGRIYEGLGWDSYNDIRGGGLKCLRIAFIKSTRDSPPSTEAIAAYKQLVKAAICLGKLTAHYKLIPFYLIDDRFALGETSFERNLMRKWKNYNADPDLGEQPIFGKHGVVFEEEWNSKKPLETRQNMTSPVKYVVLGNYYYRCFRNCLDEVKLRQREIAKSREDIHINFYVGDDGLTYEVCGWDQSWSDYWISRNAISIDFLGKFHSYTPSEGAMRALYRLLRLGVIWGKLSPDYEIVSYRKVTDSQDYVGNALLEAIRKMPRYTDSFS